MKRAIKIDVEQKKIYEIQIGDFKTIYPAIGNGCDTFTVPIECDNGDSLYCDDEGCLQPEIKGGFIMTGFRHDAMIVGNAIILGTDEEGESVDAVSTVEELAQSVIFVDENSAKEYATTVINTPPQIYFWETK